MEGGDLCLRKTTAGVDLNRNWEYAWIKVGHLDVAMRFTRIHLTSCPLSTA